MEILALVLIVLAIGAALYHATRSRPWHLGWVAVALIALALFLWHALGIGPVGADD